MHVIVVVSDYFMCFRINFINCIQFYTWILILSYCFSLCISIHYYYFVDVYYLSLVFVFPIHVINYLDSSKVNFVSNYIDVLMAISIHHYLRNLHHSYNYLFDVIYYFSNFSTLLSAYYFRGIKFYMAEQGMTSLITYLMVIIHYLLTS